MRILCLIIFLLINTTSFAQSWAVDEALLSTTKSSVDMTATQKVKNGFNPGRFMYNISMGFYQKHLSSQIGSNCIYETTCSRFSRKLVSEFGIVKGFFLSLDRVGRCNKLAYAEASPLRLNKEGKIIEYPSDFRIRK